MVINCFLFATMGSKTPSPLYQNYCLVGSLQICKNMIQTKYLKPSITNNKWILYIVFQNIMKKIYEHAKTLPTLSEKNIEHTVDGQEI